MTRPTWFPARLWLGAAAGLALLAVPAQAGARPHRAPGARPHRAPAARPLRALTDAPAAVTPVSARLQGRVDLTGRPVGYWFQYGAGAGFDHHTRAVRSRGRRGVLRAGASVFHLPPASTIHYRLVASVCGGCRRGTAYGRASSLTTGGYRNPVFGIDAPDPSVLDRRRAGDGFWAFTTGDRFPVLHSVDLVQWRPIGVAFHARPAWVVQSGDWHPWAPNVNEVRGACPGTSSSNCFVMFYVGLSRRFDVNCVAVATATTPAGPYVDRGPLTGINSDAAAAPAGCADAAGTGEIDPFLFVDPRTGRHLLYVSEDFACSPPRQVCTKATGTLAPTISVIPVSADDLQAEGDRLALFAGSRSGWEAAGATVPTVEGPSVLFHHGMYYMLYSGGSWHTSYGEGYAISASPWGTWVRAPQNPILSGGSGVLSPGGAEGPVAGPHGEMWLAYHGRTGSYDQPRTLRLDPFTWVPVPGRPDRPVVAGPSAAPRPLQP